MARLSAGQMGQAALGVERQGMRRGELVRVTLIAVNDDGFDFLGGNEVTFGEWHGWLLGFGTRLGNERRPSGRHAGNGLVAVKVRLTFDIVVHSNGVCDVFV